MSTLLEKLEANPRVGQPTAEPIPATHRPHLTPSPLDEAPDWGEPESEAPEARIGRDQEAPDAGEGRMSLLEGEFTHGRSQS